MTRRHRTLRSRLLRRGHNVCTPQPRPLVEDLRLRDLVEEREREAEERQAEEGPPA